MILCLNVQTGTGCNAENPNTAQHCRQCGRPLRFALQFHDPGTLVGAYRIVRVLGFGAFGAVYAAEDTRMPALQIALKETLDPSSIRSFQDEFAILQRLDHPNLPSYHATFEANGYGYLVMELVSGQSLQDVLDRRTGPLVEAQVLGYALQLCAALRYLHAQPTPILHRDLKPTNIRLTPEGLIKLVDFGLLKQGDGLTRSTRMGLTIAYAPLEQYGGTGQHTDARSDVYSLGATLYHLLTGQEPPAVPERIASSPDPLVAPRQLNGQISEVVSAAVVTAMGLRPAERFATVAALEQALLGRDASRAAVVPPAATAPTIVTPTVAQATIAAAAAVGPTVPLAAPGSNGLGRQAATLPAQPIRAKRSRRIFLPILLLVALASGAGAFAYQRQVAREHGRPEATLAAGAPDAVAAPEAAAVAPADEVEAAAAAHIAAAPTEEPIVAAADEAAQSPINDKVIVVGINQEIDTFFGLESNALATTEVLSPTGLCITTLDYGYQPTYCFDEFPTFDNGGAVTSMVRVDPSAISPNHPIEVDGQLVTDTAIAEAAGIEIPSELDQLTLTWKLAEDLYWDDGTQVTSADVLESYRVQKDPETLLVSRQLVNRTLNMEAPDDFTVVQTMAPGYLDFSYFVDPWMSFLPAHLYAGKPVSEIRDAESARPSSYGPFMFQEYEPGVQATFVSNPYFATQPKVGTLIFKFIADSNQVLAQLETGEIDLPTSSSLTLDFVPQLDELEAAGTITTNYVAGTFWEHLDFGIRRGGGQPSFFDDVRIRQAVAYGINRGQIVDDVQYGRTQVMNTIVPDDHPAYPSGLDEYAYDPDRANELLDEAGVTDSDGDGIREKDGRPLAMTLYTTSNNAVRQAVAEIIQQNLGELGFDISLEFVPGPDKLFKQGPDGILSPRLFDLAMYAYLSGVQPGVDLYYCDQLPTPENSFSGQNNPGYCNPDYDTAGRAAQAELDIENWPEVYQEPLTIINRDLPTFPLYQRLKIGAYKEGVTGPAPNATMNQDTYNTEEWDIAIE